MMNVKVFIPRFKIEFPVEGLNTHSSVFSGSFFFKQGKLYLAVVQFKHVFTYPVS